jgi:aspartate racemase
VAAKGKSRCVGLLGGVGVGAATHYYAELARACDARGVELDLVMVNGDTPRVLEYVEAGNRAGLAAYLNGFLARMKAAGAEFAVIPSVTTHFAIAELRELGTLPVVDIFAPFRAEVERRGVRRVTVFGTRFVMQSKMYGFVPEVEFVAARPEETDVIHETYLRLALDGRGTKEQYERLRELALRLCERERLDAIVMGGTDLSLIFNEGNMDFPHLDCAALHLRSVADALLG